MDLVDIDKVLDDLELDEDENKSPGNVKSSQGAASASAKSQHQNSTQNNASYPVNSQTEANNNEKPSKSKSFVNITNVFSSLQEYVNVDIDHIIRAADPIDRPECSERVQEAVEAGHIRTLEDQSRDVNDDEEECTECYPDDGNGGGMTSASSITTSSPSSFSSGPSPGSSSDSSEIYTSDDKLSNVSKTRDDYNEGESHNQPSKNSKKSAVDSDLILESKERCNEMDCNNEGETFATSRRQQSSIRNGEENSLELGLSSVSSCLYNENTSSSFPGLSNDLYKLDALSSIPSSTPKDSDGSLPDEAEGDLRENTNNNDHVTAINTAEQEKETTDPMKTETIENAPGQIDREVERPIVVGFGSTMDEISDTELDSILQEIDSDLQVFQKMKSPDSKSESKIEVPVSGDCDEVTDVAEIAHPGNDPSDIVEAKSAQDEKIEAESDIEGSHDYIANVDNFSQASTVEFADIRVQTDFDHEPMAGELSSNALPTEPTTNYESNAMKSNIDQACNSIGSTPKLGQQRPNSLDIPVQSVNVNSTAGQTPPASGVDEESNAISNSSSDDLSPQIYSQEVEGVTAATVNQAAPGLSGDSKLGKVPPFWIPDSEAPVCMQCQVKFSLIKRRHHCRACGLVLCSTCCSQKAKLEFFGDVEVRVCVQCHFILRERLMVSNEMNRTGSAVNGSSVVNRSPNPNNPMEYCSMIPPHQQVTGAVAATNPISVMVPVGVLKREGVPPKNNRKDKNVIFSDGIRPGCDLAELDENWEDKGESSMNNRKSGSNGRKSQAQSGLSSPPYHGSNSSRSTPSASKFQESDSFIPEAANGLPPIYTRNLTESELTEVVNNANLISRLKSETLQFALQRNLYVYVKIVTLKCCVNKTVINFTTRGMHHVGQDEIIILLEYSEAAEKEQEGLPKDIFIHLNQIYCQAYKGRTVNELGFTVPSSQTFLGSRGHGGFLYIRPTFQCLHELQIPDAPFLIGILINRWEVPWARIFPLRLMLRLGAQYRYYPCPHVSVPFREPVYGDIAQTIINFLADFRNYSYTLATIRGMYIYMEDRKTSVLIPQNRHDQVLKALNNSSDHILAFGANLSKKADGHLVCIQNMESNCSESHTYSTQAINIQGQPTKVTGASFLVLNGALKSTSGLQGKCSIVEDGLMVQILPAKMSLIRTALQNKQDVEIVCGPVDADETQTETVNLRWTEDDTEFNIEYTHITSSIYNEYFIKIVYLNSVKSPIDGKKMDGIPSIRVHSGLNYSNASHMIRWTEVFMIQNESSTPNKEAFDVQKVSEQIAESASTALVSFLDLLAACGCIKIGLRVTLHRDNVCYETGSLNAKLAPLYMNALDNELIPTLHSQTTNLHGINKPIILELIFYILDK